jgi:hypothetical protein
LDVVGVFLPYYRNAEASIAAARKGIHVVGTATKIIPTTPVSRTTLACSSSSTTAARPWPTSTTSAPQPRPPTATTGYGLLEAKAYWRSLGLRAECS